MYFLFNTCLLYYPRGFTVCTFYSTLVCCTILGASLYVLSIQLLSVVLSYGLHCMYFLFNSCLLYYPRGFTVCTFYSILVYCTILGASLYVLSIQHLSVVLS